METKRIDFMSLIDKENTDEATVKLIQSLENKANEGLDNAIKGLDTKDQLQKCEDAIKELKTLVSDTKRIEAIEEKIIKLNASVTKAETKADAKAKIVDSFKAFVETDAKGVKTINFRSALRNGQVRVDIDTKDATTIFANGATNKTVTENGISSPVSYKPWLFDVANANTVNGSTVNYVEKVNKQGGAKFVAEGALKPLISWEYREQSKKMKKAAVTAKFSLEAEQDIDGFLQDLVNELRTDLRGAIETGILSGDGADGTIDGVVDDMPKFELTGLSVKEPNNFDAIVAAATQVKVSALGNFIPTNVVLNPVDVANMKLTKDSAGRYVLPISTKEGSPLDLDVIESANIAAGSLIVGDFSKLDIREAKEMQLIFGFVNDDLQRNLMTVIAEARLVPFIKENNKTAFVADTFANIKAGIQAQ